jgi:tetratricopeptide (TPR) repeat protein
LPVAAGCYHLLTRLQKSGTGQAAWLGVMVCVIVALGVFTYERNHDWATPESLWRDAVVKAPQNSRPYIFLGVELAWREKATPADLRHALVLFKHSLNLDMHNTIDRAKTLGNIAWVYFFQMEDHKAVDTFRQAVTEFPDFDKNRRDIISPLMRLRQFEEAEHQARFLVNKFSGNPEYWNILGLVLLWRENFEASLACLQAAMRYEPGINENLLFYLGVALTRAGHLERGGWFLRQAMKYSGDRPLKQLAWIENRVRAKDFETARLIAGQLVDVMPVSAIHTLFESLSQYRSVPVAVDLIRPVVYEAIAGMTKKETGLHG